MRTMKGIPWRMGLVGLVTGLILGVTAPGARAQLTGTCSDVTNCRIGTDRPASIVIYPRIVVDSEGLVYTPGAHTDTIISLVNAGERKNIDAQCFFVNANGHCSNDQDVCNPNAPNTCGEGATCVPGWAPRDFHLTLTKRQPISFRASIGAPFLPCDPASPESGTCTKDDQGNQIFNAGSIPPVQEDPFIGELKCIQTDENDVPVEFNELMGSATIISTSGGTVDANKQNAIGIQAIPGQLNDDNILCIGGQPDNDCPNGAEYVGCPETLIVDHFFDDAEVDGFPVHSNLTLVPCSEDFQTITNNLTTQTTVQFLVFNEFEERFSTSFRFGCFVDRPLSDIDTRLGTSDNGASIFNVGVEGTLTGQSRIRGVEAGGFAHGLLGELTVFSECSNGPNGVCSAATNLHMQGQHSAGDEIILH